MLYTFPKEDAEGYCAFYDKKTKECRVQSVKPETCVAGPVTFDLNTKSQKIEWYLKTEKMCPLAGKLYKNEPMLKRHLESAKKEIIRLVRDLNPEALQTTLKIEEPETFKIDEDNVGKDILNKLTRNT
jgi:Fe-S-cluster containining protein